MAAPSYLNVGTAAVSAGATNRNPALPASRVNGNILIAVVGSKNNATHSISGTGWASLASQTNSGASFTVSYWWRVVDGSEATPTISWTGSVACFGQIVQYTRQNSDTTAPFGTIGTAGTGTGATHTSTGFNSTRNNSLIIYIDAAAANTALAQPANWTERYDAGSATGATRHAGGTRALTTSGSASGNISVTGANAAWVQRQFELLEPILTGTLAATESGSDTFAATGLVEITGTLAATETGSDTFAAVGLVEITGTLAAQEEGSDTFAATGTVDDGPEPEVDATDNHDGVGVWDVSKSKREERKEARTLREIIEQAWEPQKVADPATEPRKPKRAVIREVMQTADLAGVQYSLAKINRLMESVERERARQAMMEDEDEVITLLLMVA